MVVVAERQAHSEVVVVAERQAHKVEVPPIESDGSSQAVTENEQAVCMQKCGNSAVTILLVRKGSHTIRPAIEMPQ